MKHVPHLHLPAPWDDGALVPLEAQARHLQKALRMKPGDEVSYTDGSGVVGLGSLEPDLTVSRGEERLVPKPTQLHVAAAPPSARDRQRFLVEKLSEMGVERLSWLRTRHGTGRVASPEKLSAWARGGLEQSRGAWLIDVGDALVDWADLVPPLVVCEQGGPAPAGSPRTVVVGPEGGWAEGELPSGSQRLGLGSTVLRVETAAIAAVALLGRVSIRKQENPDNSG